MTTQLVIAIGLPTVLLIGGQLLNWTAVKDVSSRLIPIESDMRQFYRAIGEEERRLEAVSKPSRCGKQA